MPIAPPELPDPLTPPPIPPVRVPAEPPAWPIKTVGLALLMGFLAQALAFRHQPGIGAAAAGILLAIALQYGPSKTTPNRWLVGAAVALFASVAIRSSETLVTLNLAAGMGTLALATYSTLRPVATWNVTQTVLGIFSPILGAAAFGPSITLRSMRGHRIGGIARILIGIGFGAPILLIFAALFASADEVFSEFIERVVSIEAIGDVFEHGLWTLFVGVGLVGLWAFSSRVDKTLLDVERSPMGRSVETATVLVLLNAMFATFLVIQVGYLFGGVDENPVTVAEHARRGFFELVSVASLVLAVVLLAGAVGHAAPVRSRTVNRLSLTLIGLTGLVLVSAVQRMLSYWSAFGLTELRLYTTVFMLWVAVALVAMWFAILRADTKPFVRVVLSVALALLLGLTLANPDRMITETNLARQGPIETDTAYLGGLSWDRAPVTVDYLITHDLVCDFRFRTDLDNDMDRLNERLSESWLSASWSSTRARTAYARLPPCP